MTADRKRRRHGLAEGVNENDGRGVAAAPGRHGAHTAVQRPRPLTEADILLSEPVLPEDETADELIAAVRRWRREGGHA
jgi:hypothetical protein